MAYLTKISDDNYIYSYFGVSGSILKEYMNPVGIEVTLMTSPFRKPCGRAIFFVETLSRSGWMQR